MTDILSKACSLERYRSSSSSSSSSSTSPTSNSLLPQLLSAPRMPSAGYPPSLPPPHNSQFSTYPPPPPPPTRSMPPPNRAENLTIYNSAPYVYENGRRFHGYRQGLYMYPNDEEEQNRLDIFHKLYLVTRRDQLHRAPITRNYTQTRILDLGSGTGIWAIDMADKYPDAEVIGTDLSPIQPKWIPRNLRFQICDFESEWTLGRESFDLIHLRNSCGSVSDWLRLYIKVYEHLKPTYGWIEQVEIDYEPRCDDNTLSTNSYVSQWYRYLVDATESAGKPIQYQHATGTMLARAGFVDIQEIILRVPYSPWPMDPHEREVGNWYTLAMSEGLESLCIAPFHRCLGWSAETIRQMLVPVKKEMLSKRIHAYNNMHIWIARRK